MELCLTVGCGWLRSLPYLPMLMDPLVSAQRLSDAGQPDTADAAGCVDNLQPDFLCGHIQPVRAELMQVARRPVLRQEGTAAGPPPSGSSPRRALAGTLLRCRWGLRLAA